MRVQSLRFIALLFSVAILVTAFESQARPWGWAKRLPVNHYTPEDIEIVKQVMRQALEEGDNGGVFEWSNPDSGHSGSVSPRTDTLQDGKRCRQTRFTSHTQGEQNVSEFFLCRQADGVWAVEQPANQ